MKEKEILAKYPNIEIYDLSVFLRKNKLAHEFGFWGDLNTEEANVIQYLEALNK